jgi:hypothetical protein
MLPEIFSTAKQNKSYVNLDRPISNRITNETVKHNHKRGELRDLLQIKLFHFQSNREPKQDLNKIEDQNRKH